MHGETLAGELVIWTLNQDELVSVLSGVHLSASKGIHVDIRDYRLSAPRLSSTLYVLLKSIENVLVRVHQGYARNRIL